MQNIHTSYLRNNSFVIGTPGSGNGGGDGVGDMSCDDSESDLCSCHSCSSSCNLLPLENYTITISYYFSFPNFSPALREAQESKQQNNLIPLISSFIHLYLFCYTIQTFPVVGIEPMISNADDRIATAMPLIDVSFVIKEYFCIRSR